MADPIDRFPPEVEDISGKPIFENMKFLVIAYGKREAPDYSIVDKERNTLTHCYGWQAIPLRQKQEVWKMLTPTEDEVEQFLGVLAWLGAQPLNIH